MINDRRPDDMKRITSAELADEYIEEQIRNLREQIGDKKVLLALSGGVDSSVVAALLIKAVGKQLVCVHVNHGLLRKGEPEQVIEVFKNQMNAKTLDYCEHFKNHFIQTIGKYLYSYAIILFITFIELSILFTIAKVNRPVLIAFAVALFDIMPIVGTSTVMIPWMIIDIVTKNYKQAIILAIGFIIMQIVRQFTEPRVVGKRVGLNPVLALICMYVGLRRFGILGMFGIPITLVVLIEMHKAGLINLYHEPDIKSE